MREYKCAECGMVGHRLFRTAGSSHVHLLCVTCAEMDEETAYDPAHPSTVGWRISAVPTEDGEEWYGYSSVPTERVIWWYSLPLRPAQTDAERASEQRLLYESAARDMATAWRLFEHRGVETRRLLAGLALINDVLDMALTSRAAQHKQLVWLAIAVQTLQQGGTPTHPRPEGDHERQ